MIKMLGHLLEAALCMSLLLAVVDLANAQSPRLVFIRRQSENQITLECRDMNSSPLPSPQFWVERFDLPRQPVNSGSPRNGQITFVITQDLEGMYSCSNNDVFSNKLDLVAYPRPNFINIPCFEVGQPATIGCPIMPGNLRQYYRVSWMSGSLTIATWASNSQFVQPRYQLHNNFSLTIQDIRLSDSNTSYVCTVTINDPQIPGSDMNKVYDERQLGVITVMVIARPIIVTPLRHTVVVVHRGNQGSVNFSCSAWGIPTPTISWFLNERNITQSDDRRFRELSSTAGATATCQLTISELHATDSGTVKCMVAASVQTMSGVRNFKNVSQASLSVLKTNEFTAADFEPEVVITTGGDVQFHVTLLAAIPETLRLRIHFVAEDNLRNVHSQTSNGAFTNLTKIFYEVQKSRVPLQRFKVQLALVVENRVGPFVPADLEFATVYDLKVPTDSDRYTTILAIVCPIVGAALITVLVIVVAISCLKMRVIKSRCNQQTAVKFNDFADGLYNRAENPGLNPVVRDRYLQEAAKDKQHARNVADGDEEEEATHAVET